MTWTYDETDLDSGTAAGRKNIVRLRIGDTISTDPQMQNEEIAYFLSLYSDGTLLAAIASVRALKARFARQVDVSHGPSSVKAGARVKAYDEMLVALEGESNATAIPYAGGLSISEKRDRREDTDAVQPFFARGQDDRDPPIVPSNTLEST